ncbi:MAG TPA: hypothetical protein VKX28_07685 [Xanthobacteraceae bacterium]|nr:hypothetical protein [Xanthobacteraceae bacterium]
MSAILITIAALISACDPVTENQYYREGIGTNIPNSNIVSVTELQDVYLDELCRQAGVTPPSSSTTACQPAGFSPGWGLIVQAGLNDIDARCDAYLAWLDDKRRSQAPIVAEINSLNTAAQAIMRVTGVGANPITLVGVAFGLASDTFTNIQSRLLLEVDHSTVQSVVLSRQQSYREEINTQTIDNRAAAIYALRSYLRLCMPMTIEMNINTTVTIFEHNGPQGLDDKKPLIDPHLVGGVALHATQKVTKPDRRPQQPALPADVAELFVAPQSISLSYYKTIQKTLCVPDSESGQAGNYTKGAIKIFLAAFHAKDTKLNGNEIDEIIGLGKCLPDRGQNYFEKNTYDTPDPSDGIQALHQLINGLNAAQPTPKTPLSCDIKSIGDKDLRARIAAVRPQIKPALLTLSLPKAFSNQVTPDLLLALPQPTDGACK